MTDADMGRRWVIILINLISSKSGVHLAVE
jgi:hypothetical protein